MAAEKVVITKSKLDNLAEIISSKSEEPIPLTIDEMSAAVLDFNLVNNQNNITVTPTVSEQIITPESPYTGLDSVTVEAISPVRSQEDLTTDGPYVDVPKGWYPRSVWGQVGEGVLDSPRFTRTNYTDHVVLTPKVNVSQSGYIWATSSTGTSVTISASNVTNGTKSITQNGTFDVTNYKNASVNVPVPTITALTVTPTKEQQNFSDGAYNPVTVNAIPSQYIIPVYQSKTVTPTKSQQTVSPDSGYDGLDEVTVNAIPSQYIIPSGSISITEDGTYDITDKEEAVVNISKQALTVTPTKTQQVFDGGIPDASPIFYEMISDNTTVTFADPLIPGNKYYVDLTVWRDISDYSPTYSRISSIVCSETEQPINELNINYPYIYISSTTVRSAKWGYERYTIKIYKEVYHPYLPVTVNPIPSEYIIPEGTLEVTQNGTVDVTQYASATVSVPSSAPTLQSKTVTPTESQQVVTADTGYDGMDEVTVNAIPVIVSTDYNINIGSKEFYTENNIRKYRERPSITSTKTGYLSFSSSQEYVGDYEVRQAIPSGLTVTPKKYSTYIGGSGYILEGAVEVTAIPSEYIIPTGELEITTNGTSDVTNYASVDVNVQPTLQSKTITPTESQQTVSPDSGYDALSSVTVGAISSTYVGSGITRRGANNELEDWLDDEGMVVAPVGYYPEMSVIEIQSASHNNPVISVNTSTGLITASHTQSKGYVSVNEAGTTSGTLQLTTQATSTITPTETEQTAVSAGKYTLGDVKVSAISSTYVGSDITQRSSTDLTASGATVTVPAGYYAEQETKTVASGSATAPATIMGGSGATVGRNSSGVISLVKTVSITPTVTPGYISTGTAGDSQIILSTQGTVVQETTYTPTTSDQTIFNSGIHYFEGVQKVAGDSDLIAENIKKDVDIFGVTGTYEGTVINNQDKSFTPDETGSIITPDEGYTGLGSVTVNAISSSYVGSGIDRRSSSDLTGDYGATATGKYTVTAPSGYYESDATYSLTSKGASNITTSTSGGNLTVTWEQGFYGGGGKTIATVRNSDDLAVSGATVTVPAGYYATAASASVASGSATTPATSITANPTISVSSSGLITASVSASQNVTPTVSAGYVSSGTAGAISVSGSKTQQLTTKAAATITPGTTNQTIAAGTYLTGTQTIAGDADLVAGNIKAGVQIFGVTGNLSFITYYTGSSDPSSSLGSDGDIYLKVA